MSSWVRASGGIVLLFGMFLSPLQWGHSQSAFQLAAAGRSAEAMAVFFGAVVLAGTAVVTTYWKRRRLEWLDMLLTLASSVLVVLFLWRFGQVTRGIALSWAGVLVVGGLVMIATGSYGRYREAD